MAGGRGSGTENNSIPPLVILGERFAEGTVPVVASALMLKTLLVTLRWSRVKKRVCRSGDASQALLLVVLLPF